MTQIMEYLTHRSKRWKAGAVGLLLLALLATWGLLRGTDKRQIADLPQPVIDSLTQQPVWCYVEFSDGRMESLITGYHPAPMDEAFAHYGYELHDDNVAKQMLRCYTSWQAAFTHEGFLLTGRRYDLIKNLRRDMPSVPNESDYQVAVLYSLFERGWKRRVDLTYSPPVTPQPWSLTEGQEETLRLR